MNPMKQWLPDTAVKHSSLMPQAHPRMTQSSPPHMSGSPQHLYAMAALAYVLTIAAELLEGTALLLRFFAGIIAAGAAPGAVPDHPGGSDCPHRNRRAPQGGVPQGGVHQGSRRPGQDHSGQGLDSARVPSSPRASNQDHGRLGRSDSQDDGRLGESKDPQSVVLSPDLAASSSQPSHNYFATRGNIERADANGCYHLLRDCRAFDIATSDVVSVSESEVRNLKFRPCTFCWPATSGPQ